MSAFIESIVLARREAADDAGALAECATQLQQHNRDLKQYIAKLDAEAVKEATAGWGTNDRKLIVSLCSRTKSQLRRRALDQSVAPTHNPEHLHCYGRRGTWLRVRATAPIPFPSTTARHSTAHSHHLSAARRTAAKYRELYDEDLREAVQSETSGNYGRLVGLALAPKDVFFADIIDKACPNPDPKPSF